MDETPDAATAETTAPTPAPEQATPPVEATPVAETPLQAVEEHAAELAKEVEALAATSEAPVEPAPTEPVPTVAPTKEQLVYRTDGYETLPRHEEGLYWFHGSVHAVAPEVAERLLALTGFSRRGKV